MTKTAINRTLFFLICLVCSDHAIAAGFDCAKAASNNEIKICGDAWLSKLDETYTNLYRVTRESVRSQQSELKRVKAQARAALKQRNAQCSDRTCLVEWYQQGNARLIGDLRKHNPQTLKTDLTPYKLYQQLNLRSFKSMLGPRVKYHCETYLSEYYPDSAISLTDSQLTINDDSDYWQITILNENTINIVNRSLQGTYNTTSTDTVYFHPGSEDIRVKLTEKDGDDTFAIAQKENCVPLNGRPKVNRTFDSFAVQSRSVGEFDLAKEFEPSTFPIYESIEGAIVGEMTISVVFDGVEGTTPSISIKSNKNVALPEPQTLYRAKFYPALLVFDQSNGWFNISADTQRKLWLNVDTLPPQLASVFNTREEVMLTGSIITVKSAHRLRAESNTDSAILKVLRPYENDQIWPMEIMGDWMRVVSISPEPIEMSLEELREDPKFTVLEGWLKWRESAKKQYIDVHHWFGL